MKIVLKFAKSNIRNAKAKVLVLIICVAISCFVLMASLCVPKGIWNYNVDVMTSFYGNSDIYISPNDISVQRYSSTTYIPQSTKDKCEYIYTIFAYQDYVSTQSDDTMLLYNLIGLNYSDLQNFNTNIKYEKNCSPTGLGELEIVVSKEFANENNLALGGSIYLSDYKFTAKVVGIAKSEGYFSNKQNIFTSKETIIRLMRTAGVSLMNSTNKDNIFNIAVVKVKDGYEINDVIGELNASLTNFESKPTVDVDEINTYINFVIGPFTLIASIVVVFCIFIILIVCNIIFTERLKEFATLKSIGATNRQLVASLLIESGTYGAIGGLAGSIVTFGLAKLLEYTSMPFIRDIPFVYYLYVFIYGVGFAVLSALIPAIIHSRKSIRQTMILSSKSKVMNIVWLSLGLVFMLTAIICLIFYRHYEKSIVSIILMVSTLLSVVFLSPYVVFGLVKLLSITFKKIYGFRMLYVKNNSLTSSVAMIIRLTAFGMAVFLLLNMLPGIIRSAMKTETSRMNYDIILSDIGGDKDDIVDFISNIEHVDDVYKVYTYDKADVSLGRSVFAVGMNYKSIMGEYGENIVDDYDSVASKMADSTKPYILIGEAYKIFNDVRIGDIVTLNIDDRITNFIVAGYIDAMTKVNNIMIFNIDYVNDLYGKELADNIYVKLDDNKNYHQVYDSLMSNRVTKRATITNYYQDMAVLTQDIGDVLVLVEGYSYVVMGLCFIAIAVAIVLSLKNNILQHKILTLLGMSKKLYLHSFASMMAFILLITAPIGILSTAVVFGLLADMLLNFNMFFVFSVSFLRMYIAAVVASVLLLGISTLIADYSRKDFIPKMIIEEG